MSRLVIVGASLAGLRAAEAARRVGFLGEIRLIGSERHPPYDRPPLSKRLLEADEEIDVSLCKLEHLTAKLGVTLQLGEPATELLLEERAVLVPSGRVDFDALVIATGAVARQLAGTQRLAGVHQLRTLDDARAVRAALREKARTVVIGAGFIGAEVASCARRMGLPVTLVEASPTPLARSVGAAVGGRLSSLHHQHGTDLRCGVTPLRIEGERRVERVVLSDGSSLEADLVVVGIGTVPSTDWLVGSGLTLDNGVCCDETLSTGHDRIYAAGDVARWPNALFGRTMRLEHWTSAAEQGALAGANAVGSSATAYTTVPYFWSDWYGRRIQFVGIPECDETEVVLDDKASGRVVVLYRSGELLVGALTIDGQGVVMKYRALIAKRALWRDALDFARTRARST